MSCSEEFFDTPLGGRIDPSQHYKSNYDALLSYMGCFVFLQDIAERQVIVDGLRSDMMDITNNADVEMIELNLHRLSADNSYIDPSNYYKLIININEVLPNLPQILELDRDFDEFTLNVYEGTLITLRSWAYFMLAKTNGEVALVPEDQTNLDLTEKPEYKTKAEIIDVLIDELLVYNDPKDIVRYNLDHYVLLGELYLEKQDYENAAKFLKFAIDGPAIRNRYMVATGYDRESWEKIFMNSVNQTGAVITAVPYSFVDGQKNMLEEWTSIDYKYMVKPSVVLIDSFKTQIQQNGSEGDEYRGKGVSYDISSGKAYINKYSLDDGVPHSADVILYRAADVHMLLAEALNRLGDYEKALILLNRGFSSLGVDDRPYEYVKWTTNKGIRGRSYLQDKVVPPSDTANPMIYIEDLIIQERALELAFEGKRWFDLVRIAERRDEPAYLANKVAAKFTDPSLAEEIRIKLLDEQNWYLPIPKVTDE